MSTSTSSSRIAATAPSRRSPSTARRATAARTASVQSSRASAASAPAASGISARTAPSAVAIASRTPASCSALAAASSAARPRHWRAAAARTSGTGSPASSVASSGSSGASCAMPAMRWAGSACSCSAEREKSLVIMIGRRRGAFAHGCPDDKPDSRRDCAFLHNGVPAAIATGTPDTPAAVEARAPRVESGATMDESSALLVTAVRAVETGDATHRVWSDADRSWASRAAAEVVGEGASPDTFIARRARLAGERLGEAHRALPRAVAALRWRPWVGWTLVAGAFVLGIAFDRVGGAQRVNLLAPPVFALLAWNVAVYVALAAAAVLRLGGDRGPGPLRALVARLGGRAGGSGASPPPAAKESDGGIAACLAALTAAWARLAAPLYAARSARILHLAAAALALGVIAGLYTRGLAFEYRATWESTFLDAGAVRSLLAVALAPGAWLTGLAVPDEPAVAALRAPGSENAARWLHLMAGSVVAIVVLPRLLLAAFAGLVERRRARQLPMPLDEPYFQRLLRGFRGGPVRLGVVPYSYALPPAGMTGLEAIAARAFGGSAALVVEAPLAYGDEDAFARRERGGRPAARWSRCSARRPHPRRRRTARSWRRWPLGATPRGRCWRSSTSRRCASAGAATRSACASAARCGRVSSTDAGAARAVRRSRRARPRRGRHRDRRRTGRRAAGRGRVDERRPFARRLADLAHQRGQDDARAHAARPRRRRSARRAARHHRGDAVHAAGHRRGRPPRPLGHAGLRRQRAARPPAAPAGQPDRLVPVRGLGPLPRPHVLADAARRAQRARPGRRRPLPRQRRRGAGRRRLPRPRARRAGVDRQAGDRAPEPDRAAAGPRRRGRRRSPLARRPRPLAHRARNPDAGRLRPLLGAGTRAVRRHRPDAAGGAAPAARAPHRRLDAPPHGAVRRGDGRARRPDRARRGRPRGAAGRPAARQARPLARHRAAGRRGAGGRGRAGDERAPAGRPRRRQRDADRRPRPRGPRRGGSHRAARHRRAHRSPGRRRARRR